jgi:hypothetical protein
MIPETLMTISENHCISACVRKVVKLCGHFQSIITVNTGVFLAHR